MFRIGKGSFGMKFGVPLVAVTLSVVALAGCIEDGTGAVDELVAGALAQSGRLTGTIMEGQNCETSVGLSMAGPMFNEGPVMGLFGDYVGPFKVKDVKEISGVQFVGIVGMVMVGPPGSPATGVWHGMSRCDTYTDLNGVTQENWQQGWIAAYIEPPEWGADGIDHHFFVADLSFSDVPIVERVLAGTSLGVELNPTVYAEIGWPLPNVMHATLHDSMHGLFEWQTVQKPAQPRESTTIRFWTLVHESNTVPPSHFGVNTHGFRDPNVGDPAHENEGNGEIEGRYYPVVFDVVHEAIPGESIVMFPAESTGTFSHSEYCHHGHPESEAMHSHSDGEVCQDDPSKFESNADELWTEGGQTEAGLYWAGYNQKIIAGPDYSDQWFDVTWIH